MKTFLLIGIVVVTLSATCFQGASAQWKKARLTQYISYPDCCDDPNAADKEECEDYNACKYTGYFAFLKDRQTKDWVKNNNIISIHGKDSKYKLKTFELRKNGKTIQGKVYDKCDDKDCNNCCTKNAGKEKFLIDLETYTYRRFGQRDGIVEWRCVDC